MTTEVIATDRGLALLLPPECAAKVGEVEVMGTFATGLFIATFPHEPSISLQDWLNEPEQDNGLVAPDDPPPEPPLSF